MKSQAARGRRHVRGSSEESRQAAAQAGLRQRSPLLTRSSSRATWPFPCQARPPGSQCPPPMPAPTRGPQPRSSPEGAGAALTQPPPPPGVTATARRLNHERAWTWSALCRTPSCTRRVSNNTLPILLPVLVIAPNTRVLTERSNVHAPTLFITSVSFKQLNYHKLLI